MALGLTRVGLEPTPPKRLVPKTSALDHSGISSRYCLCYRPNAPIEEIALRLTRVGFEPTPTERLVPKTTASDRSAISPRICHSYRLNAPIKVPEILIPVSLGLTRVGFEPTPPKRLLPKPSALDRSVISPRYCLGHRSNASIEESHDSKNMNWEKLSTVGTRNSKSSGASFDESGIRTHASQETGALNQRLRPLGHLAKDISQQSP
ncbi:unnamed protein product [Toxocara canis]|uniref:Uncharacterized protein n=1 Tax=Toxocara canis TaxID=6265 RepID=A0A183VH87_TOXCA|nr:unnamed protein product [Toxocara canis]